MQFAHVPEEAIRAALAAEIGTWERNVNEGMYAVPTYQTPNGLEVEQLPHLSLSAWAFCDMGGNLSQVYIAPASPEGQRLQQHIDSATWRKDGCHG